MLVGPAKHEYLRSTYIVQPPRQLLLSLVQAPRVDDMYGNPAAHAEKSINGTAFVLSPAMRLGLHWVMLPGRRNAA